MNLGALFDAAETALESVSLRRIISNAVDESAKGTVPGIVRSFGEYFILHETEHHHQALFRFRIPKDSRFKNHAERAIIKRHATLRDKLINYF